MATTTPDNLRYPNPTDPFNLVADWGITVTDVQNALTRRANSYIGTAAQRIAFTTAPEGVHWQDTDGSKGYWARRGGAWVEVAAPLPAALNFYNNAAGQGITATPGTWQDFSAAAGTTTFGALTRPLEVMAYYGGVGVATGGDYNAFGVATSGGLVSAPNQLPDGTGPLDKWIYTPFNTMTNIPYYGAKRFVLPAGSAVNFRAQALRSGSSTSQFNYWQVNVVPIRWA